MHSMHLAETWDISSCRMYIRVLLIMMVEDFKLIGMACVFQNYLTLLGVFNHFLLIVILNTHRKEDKCLWGCIYWGSAWTFGPLDHWTILSFWFWEKKENKKLKELLLWKSSRRAMGQGKYFHYSFLPLFLFPRFL